MAADLQGVCVNAADASTSNDLAVLLSFLFSAYVLVAVLIAALAIYSASELGAAGVRKAERAPPAVGMFASASDVVPMIALPRSAMYS